jgi:hypothetical protein
MERKEEVPATGRSKEQEALERFSTISSYLQYENTAFWTRSGFILVAQAALLGFFANMLPEQSSSWPRVIAGFVIALVGIALTFIWNYAIRVGRDWTDRWLKLLKEHLEPAAFGDLEVFRMRDDPDRPSARAVAAAVAWLFGILWFGSALYGISVIVQKLAC